MLTQLRTHLKTKIVPFWVKLNDLEYGGFYGAVDSQTLTVDKHSDKGLVQQARLLYSFSALANHESSQVYRPLMDSAYHFLKDHMKDTVNQGYYWLSNHAGIIKDARKITYGQGFLIYGLSEYYQATQNPDALLEAMSVFDLIESKALDKETHGYWEEFDSKWNKTECLILGDGVLGTLYTLNTTLHLLEAYMNLYVASQNQNVRNSVIRIIQFFKDHLYDAKNQTLFAYLDQNLEPIGTMISYGHNIEASWLIDEACERINYYDKDTASMTRALASYVLENGFDGHYVHNHLIDNVRDKQIIWWVQSEAMIGFYNQYQKTNQDAYLIACEQIWETINRYLVDPRINGEWFWSCDSEGRPNLNRGTAELWKTPYHNSRAMMELIERIDHFAHTPEIYRTTQETVLTTQSKKHR